MVALDDGGVPLAGFDHVGVDGALGQIVHGADLLTLPLENADKLLADDLALVLRLLNAGQGGEEALLLVAADQVDVPLGEGLLHLVALVLAHQAVIHKDAGQLAAHSLRQQGGSHRGIHPAGQGQQHLALAYLGADLFNGPALVVGHSPVPHGAADLIEEVAQHLLAELGVVHLRVKLHAVELPRLIADAHGGAGLGMSRQAEAFRYPGHIVAVAHPGDAALRQTPEQGAGGIKPGLGLAILPGRVVLGGGDQAAQLMAQQLAAVADAQDGHPQAVDPRVRVGGIGGVNAVGAAGKDDAQGIVGPDLLQAHVKGFYLAIHIALPHTAGDQLVILAAEVQDQDFLVLHIPSLFSKRMLDFTPDCSRRQEQIPADRAGRSNRRRNPCPCSRTAHGAGYIWDAG